MAEALPDWMKIEPQDDWGAEDEIPCHKFYNDTISLYFDPAKHEYYRFSEEGDRVEVAGCTSVLKTAIDKSQALMPWATKLAIETLKQRMFDSNGNPKQYSTEELMMWFAEAKDKHKERLSEAGDIGHTAHDALERTIQYAIDNTGGIVSTLLPVDTSSGSEQSKMAQSCFEAGIDWIRLHKVKFLHTERKVYSLTYDVAGTLDGIGLVSSCDDLSCCRGKTFFDTPSVIDWKSSQSLRLEYALQTAWYMFSQIEEFPDEPIYLRFILRLGKTDGKFEPWLVTADYFEQDLETFLAALTLYRNLKTLEERRKADKAELRQIIKSERDTAKANQKAQEQEERRLAREESKLATKARKEASDAEYKRLRKSGLSPDEAKAVAYPKTQPEPKLADVVADVETEDQPEPEWVMYL